MKKKSKIKVPAYSVGLSQALDASSILGTTLQGAGGTAGDIGGLLSGTSSMAGAGMMVGGPVGAAVGGGLGLITGGIGLISKNKAKKRAERRAGNIRNQQYADATTSAMMEDYYGDNTLANTFAMGGVMPGNLAYVDNGEMIKTPDGTIKEVTAGSDKLTDNVLTNLPAGSKILSDKLTVPGTNKTFAQMGRGLQKRSKSKDIFAKNSANLNARNFDRLLAFQEGLKIQQGITAGAKALPAYKDGGITPVQFTKEKWDTLLDPKRKWDTTDYLDTPAINKGALTVSAPTGSKASLATLNTNLATEMPTLEKRAANTLTAQNAPAAQNAQANGMQNGQFDYRSLASFAPALYNLGQSFAKPEVESVTANPYLGNVNRLMAGRRMNIQPAINANRQRRAVNNYNLSQLNTNTGANLAARSQMAASEYSANADMYGAASNTNNGYAAEYANMLGNLGNQYVGNKMTIDDLNARNRAARRNYGSAAMSQIGEGAQMQQLMKNQARMGDLSMNALIPFLQQGFTTKQINDLKKTYYGN